MLNLDTQFTNIIDKYKKIEELLSTNNSVDSNKSPTSTPGCV